MRRLLADTGVNFETLLAQIRAQIAWVKVVNQHDRPRVNVTVDQLDLAVQEARLTASGSRSSCCPRSCCRSTIRPRRTRSRPMPAGLIQAVREGGSFELLARQVSAAASAEQGGDLGWVRGSVDPGRSAGRARAAAAPARSRHRCARRSATTCSGCAIGASPPPQLAPGRRAGRGVAVPDPVSRSTSAEGQAGAPRLREQALALRPQLVDCDAMNRIAAERQLRRRRARSAGSGSATCRRISRACLVDLPVGEVSEPLRGPAGVHLIMVCDRRGAVRSAPQRDEIAAAPRERADRSPGAALSARSAQARPSSTSGCSGRLWRGRFDAVRASRAHGDGRRAAAAAHGDRALRPARRQAPRPALPARSEPAAADRGGGRRPARPHRARGRARAGRADPGAARTPAPRGSSRSSATRAACWRCRTSPRRPAAGCG